jgi:hypothetical protein
VIQADFATPVSGLDLAAFWHLMARPTTLSVNSKDAEAKMGSEPGPRLALPIDRSLLSRRRSASTAALTTAIPGIRVDGRRRKKKPRRMAGPLSGLADG